MEKPAEKTDDDLTRRAIIVARILSEHGLHVSTPDEGFSDDIQRNRWDVCKEIAAKI